MSGNQNRKSGRPGGRGYSGGRGGAAAQTPAGSSSQQPSFNPSRSVGKRGTNNNNNNNNGQGPVVRQNPSSALSDATSGFAPATPPKGAAPNGSQSHFQPSPNETSNNVPPQSSATNNPPKSLAQIVQQRGPPPKVQNPSMPPLPSKGEQSKEPVPVPLQFGTINMGMMNGLPIPARTNSAPPNLDEQKRNQAMLNAMKASSQATPKPQIPQPRSIPTGTNIGTNTNANTNTNINTGTNANTNINTGTNANTNINTGTNTNTGAVPVQLPRQPKPQPKPQMHAPAPPTPISVPISVPIPVQPQPMPVPYPHQHQHQHQHQMPVPFQPPPNLQFGAHNPQMQMSLPVGSAPQNPQMFLHAQQQALLHQSQSMGFAGPQPGHQLPPQLGSLGMGPQYPPQQQQQQGNKYGGARKTTVKITHPDTHEEVRLDNVARGGVGNIVTGHSGQMQGFPHLGYYPVPSIQAGGYNPQMYFGNPGNMPMGGNQMQSGGPQGPRFPYPVTQTGPPINFMQQGGKPIVSAAASHGHNEGGSVEPALASRPTVTITNPAVKVSKPVSETSGKNVQAPAVSKAPLQAPSVPSIQAPSVSPVQGSSVPSVQSVPPVQAPAVLAAQVLAVAPVQAPALPEEKKKEQPKLELPVPEVTEVTKQAQIVVTKDEEKPNGTNKAPVLAKPEPTIQSKIEEEKPAKTEPKPEKAQQQEEKPVKTEAKAEKTQQEEEKPVKTEAKGEKTQQEKPSKTEAKPEKAQQEKPSKTEEKPEKTPHGVEEKPVKTEQEKKNDEAPADKVSEKESEKPSLEASKQAEEITEEEKKRPNSATSSISTDSESLSSGPSTHINGNSSKPDTKGVLGAPKDNNKPKDINNSNNNKPVVEVQKRPTSNKKKKIKEILSKADAAGSSDLYNAYKGPEEKTTEIVEIVEEVKTEAPVVNNDNNNNASEEESGANKAELDDWEDVADITTPKSPPKPQVIIPTKKKYTRDFLLTFAHQYTELPQGFNSDPGIESLLTGGGYGGGNRGGFDQTYPSPGRGGRGNDRRLVNSGSFNAGQLDDDRWGKSPGSFTPGRDMGNNYNINNQVPNLMNLRPGSSNYAMKYPRGQGGNSNQFMGGILSPMPAQGGPHRMGSDMDRWQHIPGGTQRGLIPSPVASPHQQMHKADNKYLVGKVSDEEDAKQRRLKGILNKLTPQNFDRLFEQVKEVNIDNPTTLAGVISQIFDKALMEPTFCEMYANFCSQLATALPDFNENNEKITFKRLLLNKCQEEFERGEREEAEAAKEEEGELKQTPEEREEKRIKSRRRMLGNIRLIGELYKKRMLTERIMHECIKKLLGPTQNPDEEDIEALCKLMSTIGEMIDHVKAKEHMDAYFDLMLKLSNNQKYSSRVRFMLKDTMDLRKNRWQQRRKVEGPKKIEDVHRDAANERQAQTTRLTRGGPIMNNPPSMRRTGAGTGVISPQQQGGIIRGMTPSNRMQQDIRYEERGGGGDRYQFDNNSRNQNVNVPLLRREESLTLGPQGGLGRGMSIRGQGQPPILSSGPSGSNGSRLASPDERSGPGLGGWSSSRNLERNFSAGSSTSRAVPVQVPVPSPQAVVPPVPAVSQSGGAGLPDNVVKEKSISAIREYFSARSEEEVKLCIADMKSPGSYQLIISTWINDSFERKELERDLTYKLLISLCNPKQGLFTQSHLLRGFEGVLSTLEDAVNDAPKAPEYLGQLFAKSITEGLTSLKDIGTIVLQGGEEPGMLIEAGIGGDVIGCVLECVRKDKGEGFLGEVRAKSELNLEEFKPAAPMRSKKLDPFL